MSPEGWGPSDQTPSKRPSIALAAVLIIVALCLPVFGWITSIAGITALVAGGGALWLLGTRMENASRRQLAEHYTDPVATDPLDVVRERISAAGGGVYLGVTEKGVWRCARSERAVLLLGPPRSGKTSSVIIPTVLAHDGPAVCTSTKPDVAAATWAVRAQQGRVWEFDPTGHQTGVGLMQLRWSPVPASLPWDGAILMARALTAQVGSGTTDRSHWANRAQALLAPFLHAAAVAGKDMEDVVDWVMRHDLDQAGIILEDERASRLAFGSLLGLLNTEDRERSSIFSAAADALQAYTSETALQAAKNPNFDATEFVTAGGTVYVHAPAEQQAAVAPVVCGLLAEIRRATYRAHANRTLHAGRVLFALDEVANIAPLEELPQIASEGGGQGLTLLAALQDLSQARVRWGQAADGFLTLFGAKLILPGIADTKTLEAVSVMLSEYDRKVVSTTRQQGGLFDAVLSAPGSSGGPSGKSRTESTQRTRVLSPGEIAGIPAGRALHLDGTKWELLTVTPAHVTEPWMSLTHQSGTRPRS